MGVLGGVFVLKSGLRILIRAPQVPFLVPPKTPILGVFGYFGGTPIEAKGTQNSHFPGSKCSTLTYLFSGSKMQPGTAMCFLNFYTLVFWIPLLHALQAHEKLYLASRCLRSSLATRRRPQMAGSTCRRSPRQPRSACRQSPE